MKINVLKKYAELKAMTAKELLSEWDKYLDYPPQTKSNKTYLINHIIYRIQELVYGGLTRETIDRLEALAEAEKNTIASKKPRLAVGTRLVREFKGVEHQATVTNDGYEYNGMKYRSLSGIAYAITSTRWNGNVFFGLGKKDKPRSYNRSRKAAS